MPSVSVIVPTYNRALLLPETLESIFHQTRPAEEIIVVDDGSTDHTAEILCRYPGITVITAANGGDLKARNIGLKAATSDLVAFCDSDDVWEKDFLEVMVGQWNHKTEPASCYSDFRILQGTKTQDRTKFENAPADFFKGMHALSESSGVFMDEIVCQLLTFQPLFPSCMVANRKMLLGLGGWDEGVSRLVGGDFATAIRMATHPPLALVFKPLVKIRKHENNYSGDTERMNLGDAAVLEYVLRTRPELSRHAKAIKSSADERRAAAIDLAFTRKAFYVFNENYSGLPAELKTKKRRLKRVISLARELFTSIKSISSHG
jgi:glycosyltransferase involved in cell wall biosynthesis